jgi:hypothetical protein
LGRPSLQRDDVKHCSISGMYLNFRTGLVVGWIHSVSKYYKRQSCERL